MLTVINGTSLQAPCVRVFHDRLFDVIFLTFASISKNLWTASSCTLKNSRPMLNYCGVAIRLSAFQGNFKPAGTYPYPSACLRLSWILQLAK